MSRTRPMQRGFTLIEALVAMTIIAVALIACLKAAGNLNLQQDDLIKRQYALWSADSTANWIRVSGIYPNAPQVVRSACNQGNFKFTCTLKINTTPNPNFRRIEVLVTDSHQGDKGNQLARLVVFLSSAP